MRVNEINKNQFQTQMNAQAVSRNKFGQPMKQTGNKLDPMSNLNKRYEMKKQLMGITNPKKNEPVNSVLDNSLSYIDSLKEARNKAKTATLEKKKLKYSYKSISSKIINCKKSYNAKEVISQAKREVDRLKKLRSKGEYDSEELEAAIAHAQAMERVAKKKARHLEEEEMAKIASGACMGGFEREEVEEQEEQELDEASLEEDIPDEELSAEELLGDEEAYEELDLENIVSADQMDLVMNEMLDEMAEELVDMMEEAGLDELFDDMGLSGEKDMDPADLKMMIIKHRSRELKDMVKADSDYLKVLFEKFERDKAAAGLAIRTGTTPVNAVSVSTGATPAQIANVPSVDAPVVSGDVGAAGIDISL